MKRTHWIWEGLFLVIATAIAGLVLQSLQSAQAQNVLEPEQLEGPIVQIGPDNSDEADLPATTDTQAEPAAPSYWIGLRGRNVDDPVLRTQLQLAEDMGVVVEDVVAGSPADKAGLRKHDIILRANGDGVDSMVVLQEQVRQNGEKPLELLLLRLGQETTLSITPEPRPANLDQLSDGIDANAPIGSPERALQRLLQQFNGGAGIPGGLGGRVFGQGLPLNNQRLDLNAMPNGMSVAITRQGDGPAQITVTQGDKTWNFASDDLKTLAELPQEVRQYVQGMLQGQGGGFNLQQELGNLDWEAELQHMLPERLKNLPGIQAHEGQMLERMQKLEQQLNELQQQLLEEKVPANPAPK